MPWQSETIANSILTQIACIAISIVPFLLTPFPPIPDLYNHIGRFYVMYSASDPTLLDTYYHFRWRLIANLGVDIAVFPFQAIFGPEYGPIIVTALIPPLTIAGLFSLSRAVWGRVVPAAYLSLPFVYTYTYLFGFINYHLSLMLAIWGVVLWLHMDGRALVLRWIVAAAVAFLVWLAHVGGWVIYIAVVGCCELATGHRRGYSFAKTIARACFNCLPLAPPIALSILWRTSSDARPSPIVWQWDHKLYWLSFVLRSESMVFDLLCTTLVVGVAFWLFVFARRDADVRLLTAAAALLLLFAILPSSLFGSYLADERVLPAFFLVYFLAFTIKAERASRFFLALGLGLFVVRIAATTVGWHERGTTAAAELKVLDHVPHGSRIAVLATPSFCHDWPLSGFDELPSMAIARRDAFVNTEWDVPGGQLMQPVYSLGTRYNDATSAYFNDGTRRCRNGRTVDQFFQDFPRARFDYAWLFVGQKVDLPWLQPIASGPNGTLYRVAQ